MSIIEKKEKNLNQLIEKLNSLSLSYSQPNYEIEKIRTEKNELSRQKNEIEKKNLELMREHKYLKEKVKVKLKWLVNNRKNIKGTIKSVTDDYVIINDDNESYEIKYDSIDSARLKI